MVCLLYGLAMVLRPANVSELSTCLAAASDKRESIAGFDLAALNRLLEHKPEDMTATAEAGITLAELQRQLGIRRQWLPIDPPRADQLTVGALLAGNASGPRRFGYGTIRDYLIGIKVVLGDGSCISAGGRVVKNVAGYDLCRIFIGSRGSLGVIAEATFKLRPLPEAERFVQAHCGSLDEAGRLLESVLDSELAPIALDLHGASGTAGPLALVLGFAGTDPDVAWQIERAAALGLSRPATLDYEREFWSGDAGATPGANGSSGGEVSKQAIQKLSVLPSKLIEILHGVAVAPFLARAGNGIIYYRGAPAPGSREMPSALARRLKETMDPTNILPPIPQ